MFPLAIIINVILAQILLIVLQQPWTRLDLQDFRSGISRPDRSSRSTILKRNRLITANLRARPGQPRGINVQERFQPWVVSWDGKGIIVAGHGPWVIQAGPYRPMTNSDGNKRRNRWFLVGYIRTIGKKTWQRSHSSVGRLSIFFLPVVTGRAWIPRGGGDSVSFPLPDVSLRGAELPGGHHSRSGIHTSMPAPCSSPITRPASSTRPNLLLFLLNPDFSYQAIQWLVIVHFFFAGDFDVSLHAAAAPPDAAATATALSRRPGLHVRRCLSSPTSATSISSPLPPGCRWPSLALHHAIRPVTARKVTA